MPGFDRTGPQGMGSMTGGRRGICGAAQTWGGYARGFGGGRFRGRGFGFGRNFGWAGSGYAEQLQQAVGDEKAFLRAEAEGLQRELEAIQKRLDGLEKSFSNDK